MAEETLRAENARTADKLRSHAWWVERVVIGTGIAIAFSQAAMNWQGLGPAIPIFGVFAIMAAAEMGKIPTAAAVAHAHGWRRALCALALVVLTAVSFETVFNGFERFSHTLIQRVVHARQAVQDLRGEIARLEGQGDRKGVTLDDVADVDDRQRSILEMSVSRAEAALKAAQDAGAGPGMRSLREQRDSLVAQQDAAGEKAGAAWDAEQKSIMDRLQSGALDEKMTAQLNNRMRSMPARSSVVDRARAPFDRQIAELNAKLSGTTVRMTAATKLRIDQALSALQDAQEKLAAFNDQAAQRQRDRVEDLQIKAVATEARAATIDAKKKELIAAERAFADAAIGSQMHRWASAVFGVDAIALTDGQVKQVAVFFAIIMGLAGALTGSIMTMIGEWYRIRGVQPVIQTVEVETPVDVYRYIPVFVGPSGAETEESVLSRLPADLAEQLRAELANTNRKATNHVAA